MLYHQRAFFVIFPLNYFYKSLQFTILVKIHLTCAQKIIKICGYIFVMLLWFAQQQNKNKLMAVYGKVAKKNQNRYDCIKGHSECIDNRHK